MVAPGTQVFTYFNVGKETTRGTPVAPTRQMYSVGTGFLTIDAGLNFHEGENTGRRFRTRRSTATTEDVSWKFESDSGTAYDDLIIPTSFLAGGTAFTGAGADKTYAPIPSPTALNNPLAFSIDAGDDTQNWRLQYGMAKSFKIAAAIGDVTSLSMEGFAQRAVKTAKASPAVNTSVKIPGDLWTLKQAATFAGLGAASVIPNFLVDFELEVNTGLVWRHYQDGNLFGAQHVETDISWTVTMTVESLAQAVSEFYDKSIASTMSWLRLKATGPTLGGSNYSAQFDMPVLYEVPEIIGAETDGVNLYKVVAHGADDGTNGIAPTIVSAMTTVP